MLQSNYDRAMRATKYTEFAKCFSQGCNRCSLSEHIGNYPVLYRGNPESKMMLIGEGPGKVERELGKAFVGPAGNLLDAMFNAIGISTEQDMLLSNVIFCRPVAPESSGKQNYTPKREQIVRCWPFTRRAIEIVDPDIIIACGLPAARELLDDHTISMREIEGRWLKNNIFIIRHPASILHLSIDPEAQKQVKQKVWEYLQHFRDTYLSKGITYNVTKRTRHSNSDIRGRERHTSTMGQ